MSAELVVITDVAALLFGEAEWEYEDVAPRLSAYMEWADQLRTKLTDAERERDDAKEIITEYRDENALALAYGADMEKQLQTALREKEKVEALLEWILNKASAAIGIADQPRLRFDPNEIGPAIQQYFATPEERAEAEKG